MIASPEIASPEAMECIHDCGTLLDHPQFATAVWLAVALALGVAALVLWRLKQIATNPPPKGDQD